MFRTLFALLSVLIFFTACSSNNVTVDSSMSAGFDSAGVKGTFGFFDNGQGHFTIYNLSRYRDSAYDPGATFDILTALIALQTGVVKDEQSISPAFRASDAAGGVVFDTLARRLGLDTVKKWVDSLHYGKPGFYIRRDDTAWFTGRPAITADEQLGLIKKLYFDQLPFFNRPQKLVREMMPVESNSIYRLVYKTGQSYTSGRSVGWVLGWIEENKHPYFFVLSLESTDSTKNLSVTGLNIAKNIMRSMGFFNGKK